MPVEMEVFRDMSLHGPRAKRDELRASLIAAASGKWSVDLERSDEVKRSALTDEDVVLFRYKGDPAAGLTLWGAEEGYYIPNVVPLTFGSLTIAQYNAVLQDFIEVVAAPVAEQHGFELRSTRSHQGMSDWVSEEVEMKLRRFSRAANKSTGASHPSDERRWFDFILTIHRRREHLDADRLSRWLREVERWDDETAHGLAGDYERARALLRFADEN